MAFKYDYPILDNPMRSTTGADAVPVRGRIFPPLGGATAPDFKCKDYQQVRMFFFCKNGGGAEEVAGTVTFSVWARDIVEWGDAYNLVDSPPDPTKVAWVLLADAITVDHLEEYIIDDAQKRALYIQATALAGGAIASADIFVAPFDTYRPLESM
jgi:hypothetical protein